MFNTVRGSKSKSADAISTMRSNTRKSDTRKPSKPNLIKNIVSTEAYNFAYNILHNTFATVVQKRRVNKLINRKTFSTNFKTGVFSIIISFSS